MKIYKVGGWCRDTLLGLEPKDTDYVVVGSTPEEMLSLGFKQVGCAFPVFLHPQTNEEYALARTEKKNGVGYQGFDCYFGPDVTLEEDLSRRDLTINAVAYDTETNTYIDPFHGIEDIKNKILRPTTRYFKDDPLRCLRAARFLSTFGDDWTHATSLYDYCSEMFYSGELKYLTPERIWKETQKALKGQQPSLYFDFLFDFNIFPELNALYGVNQPIAHHPEVDTYLHTMMVIDYADKIHKDSEIVFACLCHDLGKATAYNKHGNLHGHEQLGVDVVKSLCSRLKIPNTYKDLALIVTEYHTHCHKAFDMKPNKIMKLFERTNALKKPDRFLKYLSACVADAKGRGSPKCAENYTQHLYLKKCLDAVLSVDTKEISTRLLQENKSGIIIGETIRVAQINAIREVKKSWFQN